MPDPPDPHLPGILLATIAKLGWRAVVRNADGVELGELVEGSSVRPLILARGDKSGTAIWRVVDALPARTAGWLITRATFEILTHATTNADGSVAYKGSVYRMIVDYDGAHNIGTAVPS